MYKILIVDDEKIVRIALKTIINEEKNRFKIVGEARDGVSALEIVENNKIDIIVTDLKMPNMDGIELIKKLGEIGYKGKILVLSNYDDYSLVREAMKLGASDYLLKLVIEEKEFLKSLKQIANELDKELLEEKTSLREENNHDDQLFLKETFLKNLIVNMYKKQEILDNIPKLGINISENKNIILFIFIDNMRKDEIKERIKDKKMFEFSVINIITDLIRDNYIGEVIGLEYRDFVIIISVKEEVEDIEERLNQLARNISEMIEIYLNITASIVISNVCNSVDTIGDMVGQCRKAIDYKFYLGDKSIIKLRELFYSTTIPNEDYSNLIIQLKDNLRLGEINKNIAIFDAIFNKAKVENSNPQELKKIISIIIENLLSVLIEVGEKDILYIDKNKSVLHNIETLEEYRKSVIDLMNEIFERIEKNYNNKYRKEVAFAIEYIKNNIDKKLNLKMIANKTNMNESYLCRIFKNETGETLIQFINRIKIEKAKELLRSGDVMIKEVAMEVGIQDQFYFIRMFKKHVGMSPSQYKNKVYK